MKKIAVIMISFTLAFSSLFMMLDMTENVEGMDIAPTPLAGGDFGGGDGSIGNPYIIQDVLDLQNMSADLNANYTLANDIDATDTVNWNSDLGFLPIANDHTAIAIFNGSLDGAGYEIINLSINHSAISSFYVGLFGYLSGTSSVFNLGLINCNISGGYYAGSLAGYSEGNITNCYSTGNLIDAGGVTGVGGLVGGNYNGGTITNCYSTCNVSGHNIAGGFVGLNAHATITNCYSTGSVHSESHTSAGFVGANSGTIMNCYSTGNANGGYRSAGFVGWNFDIITNCYSTGNASDGEWYVGGFVGYNDGGTITNCYSKGNASDSDRFVGGFVGNNTDSGNITNCYSTGSATNGTISVGGFAGHLDTGAITGCFWDNETSGLVTSDGGIGKSTAEMKNTFTFLAYSWDFADIWSIKHTFTYPFFKRDLANDAPIAADDFETVLEDNVLSIPAEGLLANDIDWDMDTLSVSGFDAISILGSSVNVLANGSFTYDPTVGITQWLAVGEYSIDSFNYTISDVHGETDTATVYVNVTGVNDAPESSDFSIMANEDAVLSVPASEIFNHTWDKDLSDSLSVMPATFMTINGATIVLEASGQFSYDPTNSEIMQALAVSEYLEDSFEYTVSDGNGGFDTATVTINVTGANDAPTITMPNVLEIVAGQEYSVDYAAVDVDTSDILNWTLATNATWLGINSGTGILAGTPEVGDFYANITVDDGNGGSDWTNFTLTVYSDIDGDGTPDYIDPDFLEYETIVNNTVWNNQTVNQTVYTNNTVWQNSTSNVTIGVSDADSDSDGWTDAEEILAGTDPLDDTDMPADTDGDGIADFMDPTDPETITATEIPVWAWGAVIAAIVLGVLAALGWMRGGKPEVAEVPEPQTEEASPEIEEQPQEPAE